MSEPSLMSPPCAAWWGKLPSQGDFIGRRLPYALIQRWDGWLHDGMDQLHIETGEEWGARFAQAPPWFFVCPPALMGTATIGVFGPSADRIGRQFPLAIVATDERPDARLADDDLVARFLAGARAVLADAYHQALSPEQVDEQLSSLPWPFLLQERNTLIDELLADLDSASMRLIDTPTAELPRTDWRACLKTDSKTSVWWVSPTSIHAADEVIQAGVLPRQHFTRLFNGAAHR